MRSGLRTWLLLWPLFFVALSVPLHSSHAQGVPVDQATWKQTNAAQRTYKKAMKAFETKHYEEALAGFRESYGTVASPNSHLMVLRTLIELGRRVEAYEEAKLVIDEAEQVGAKSKKYLQTAEAAREEMAEVRATIGLLTVHVEPPEIEATAGEPEGNTDPDEERADRWPESWSLTVAGRPVARPSWGEPLPVEPGKIEVELSTEEGPQVATVDVAAGAAAKLTIGLPRAEEPSELPPPPPVPAQAAEGGIAKLRVPAYIAGGVGVAGALMFAIFGGLSNTTFQDLDDSCPNDACSPELEEDARDAKTQQTVANVSVVVGAVGLATGAALFVLSEWDIFGLNDEGPEEQAGATGVSIGPGAVTIRGTF